jgi:hypothetical protein
MDEFIRLKDRESEGESTKKVTSPPMRTTSERIEKLKKSFQPFWMRESRLHQFDTRGNSNMPNVLNQV